MIPRPRGRPKGKPVFHLTITVDLPPDIVARMLEASENAPRIPAATLPDILTCGILALASGIKHRDEEQAVGELHNYGVPLKELLPKGILLKGTKDKQARRSAIMERQRYLLSLERPKDKALDPDMDPAQVENDFYTKLYGANFAGSDEPLED